MSSEDPFASAAEGATKGALEYAEDKIKELVIKFRNRDIAFVQDPETINIAKEQRKTSEWNLFKQYVDDPDLHILFPEHRWYKMKSGIGSSNPARGGSKWC